MEWVWRYLASSVTDLEGSLNPNQYHEPLLPVPHSGHKPSLSLRWGKSWDHIGDTTHDHGMRQDYIRLSADG